MNIAIIDADLVGRKKHRFPNLACMKLSGYYKDLGNSVTLKLDYSGLDDYDKVYISKVFTDTPIDTFVLDYPNVEYGGTGFYYEKAPSLDDVIEHHMPDYTLYEDFIKEELDKGKNKKEFEYFTDYSIGFTTRGCFRKCDFCVNKKYDRVYLHSPLEEFYDSNKKYICLLDDNILAYPEWENIFNTLKETNKYFQYKQGLDERLLTEDKCKFLAGCKYRGDYIFAFDNIADREKIEKNLYILKKYIKKQCKFYVLCGFDRNDKYDLNFWKQDIEDTFERIKILMRYGCVPYIMRFNKYLESPYKGMYINLARWCNQVHLIKKLSFREFSTKQKGSSTRYAEDFEKDNPKIAEKYYDMKNRDINSLYEISTCN